VLRRTPVLLLLLAGLLALFALGARQRSRGLESLAREASERCLQAGAAFSNTLTLEDQNRELSLLDQRRDLVLKSSLWSRISTLSIGLALLSAVAALVSFELRAMWTAIAGLPDPRKPRHEG
jgi:hypothetical protein